MIENSLILINPSIDIFLFISLVYLFLFFYLPFFLKINLKKTPCLFLRTLATFLILGWFNYGTENIEIDFIKISWWIYILFIQILFFLIYFIFKMRKKNNRKKIKKFFQENKNKYLKFKLKKYQRDLKNLENKKESILIKSQRDVLKSKIKKIEKQFKNMI